jgi:site-specific recombinase XerD
VTRALAAQHFLARIWIDRQASRSAIKSGRRTLARIRQEARDDVELENLIEYMRSTGATVEELLGKLRSEDAQPLQINIVKYADTATG